MLKPQDLEKYGITGASEIVYNPSYDLLYEEESRSKLKYVHKYQL